MARYEKYKDSGIQWLGDVPAHWKDMPISALFSEFSDKGHPDYKVLSVYREYGVIEKDSRDDNHNVTSEKTEGYKAVSVGDFVINKMKAWQGSMGVSEYKGIVSPAYITCRFRNDNENRKFIHHLLRSQTYINHYNRLSDGVRVGQWDMHFEDFKRLRVFLPPREEQDLIVQYIELSLAEIDKAIAQQQRMIVLLNERKQIIIQNAVTKGLDPNVPMKDSGVNYIGQIPQAWGTCRLKNYLSLKGRIGWNGLRSEEFKEKSYAYLVTGQDFESSTIDWSKCYQIDKRRYDEDPFIQLKNGDLLITKDGTIGKVAKVVGMDKPACLNSGIFVMKQKKTGIFTQDFLYWYLSSNILKDYNQYTNTGTTIQHLYQNVFERMTFLIPPIEEQEKISLYLDSECTKWDEAIKQHKNIADALRERKRIIINDVVTGKIKVL